MKDKEIRKMIEMQAKASENLYDQYKKGLDTKLKILQPVNDCCYFCEHRYYKYHLKSPGSTREVSVCSLHDFVFFEDPMMVKCNDYEKATTIVDRYVGE